MFAQSPAKMHTAIPVAVPEKNSGFKAPQIVIVEASGCAIFPAATTKCKIATQLWSRNLNMPVQESTVIQIFFFTQTHFHHAAPIMAMVWRSTEAPSYECFFYFKELRSGHFGGTASREKNKYPC